jgi:general L-amino acid transport system substrate-binding protein
MRPPLALAARGGYQNFMRRILTCLFLLAGIPAAACAAAARPLACFGVVAPGLAYPDAGGIWHGMEIDLCQTLAAKTGLAPVFTPVLQDSDVPPPGTFPSVAFLPQGDIPAGYLPGPAIFDDNQALMVPAGSKARHAADLANAFICVEPGSPEDFNLTGYFQKHGIQLHEFVFQETDEMHDAYVAGRCDAITARVSLLIGLRANEDGARRNDVILPDNLGDNPVRAATPASQPEWANTVATIVQGANK